MPINLKIMAHKIFNNFMWPVTVAKKSPFDSSRMIGASVSRNINYLAIGTNAGHILFYDVLTGNICKEFYVHNNPVR